VDGLSGRARGGRPVANAAFERVAHRVAFDGSHLQVAVDEFRYADGGHATREIVELGDVVLVCAYDDEGVFMVGQPREAAGVAKLWELPAGGVDAEDGGDVIVAGRRELAEEVGKSAERWEHVRSFYSSPGTLDERIHLLFANGLGDDDSRYADDQARIEVRRVAFDELDEAIAECEDGKTLVALMELRARRS
jgi:ADP-ribose pyrophosphatase